MLESRVLLSASSWNVTLDADGDHGWDADGREFHILRTLPDATTTAPGEVSYSVTQPLTFEETFSLHSRPSAAHTIYLDFNGHVTSGTPWNSAFNNGNPFTTPPYDRDGDDTSFSQSELDDIHEVWERVVEDFAPFDVDVTTEEPPLEDLQRTGSGDTAWGIRVAIGGHFNDWLNSSAGGIAYIGSFTDSIDNPTFVFSEVLFSPKSVAEAASHEVGHTLGLGHDGDSTRAYYSGHGSGATGWAPIMGVGYSQPLVQWSRGEYAGANNQQDDLQIITTRNGFDYRTDLAGDTLATAAPLTLNGIDVDEAGVIETTGDVDVYRFTTGDGPVSFDILPWHRSPNLDIKATLVDSSGTVVATDNPIGALDAQISVTLPEGDYFLHIEGVGEGDPLGTGYTDYASLGQFTITGTITEPSDIDVELAASGDLVLTDTFDKGSDLTITVQNGTVLITSQMIALDALNGVTQISPTAVSIPLSSVTGSILLNLAGGDDHVTLDSPDGFTGLSYSFQAGDGVDSFTVAEPGVVTPVTTATYTQTGLTAGQVSFQTFGPAPAVTYTDLEQFGDGTVADTRDVRFTGAIDEIQADAGTGLTSGSVFVRAVGGTELTFPSPGDELLISATAGGTASVITVGDFNDELTASLEISGGTSDSIVVAAPFDPEASDLSLTAGSVVIDAIVGSGTTGGDVQIVADALALNQTLQSGGSLEILPLTSTTSIGIGDGASGSLNLANSEIALIGSRFQHVQIGDPAAGAGFVEITEGLFRSPLSVAGSSIAVTGLSAGPDSVELTARTGAITSLADVLDPDFEFDVSGGSVLLTTSGLVSGGIGTPTDPVYVSSTGLSTDTSATGSDQYLATVDGMTLVDADGGLITLESGTVVSAAPGSLADTDGLHLGDSGTARFELGSHHLTVPLISGGSSGGVMGLGDRQLILTGDQTAVFDGDIVGSGGLVMSGNGIQTLNGLNSYSGETQVESGTLLVNGQMDSDVSITGGVLGGSGFVSGGISISDTGGGIAPGNSPGRLTVSGDVTLDSTRSVSVEIEGLTAGTEYDQLVLDGSSVVLALNDARLSASVSGFTPNPGDQFTIVDVADPTSVVTGTFQDLPEGASVEIDGFAFEVTYAGGTDSNDVVLTAVETGVRVVALQASVTEDSGLPLGFEFQRFGQTTTAMTVNFSVDGLADSTDFVLTGASSYDAASGTGTIDLMAGDQTAEIQIVPNSDSEFELDEDVTVTVDAGTGYVPGSTVSDSSIIENDDVGISLSLNRSEIDEAGSDTLIYTFTRLEDSSGSLSVNFEIDATSDADLDVDYLLSGASSLSGTTGTVLFADGQQTLDITVTPIDDDLFELPETVIITVLDGAGYDPAEPLQASSQTGRIINEDNAPPNLNAINPVVITEGDPQQILMLGGITAGFSDQQSLRVTATSSNTAIIPDPTVVYSSPDTAGQLLFTPVADAWGPLTFTITVEDGGLDDDLSTPDDNLSISHDVDVLVRPVNDNPTLDAIASQMVDEDSGEHSVSLTGLSPGPKEFEPFRVSAVSSNPDLIPFIAFDHDPQASTGTLRYRTGAHANGSATITVTVTDAGADGTLTTPDDNLTVVQTFDVTVDAVNDPPTIAALSAVVVDEDPGTFEIFLTGISGGPQESQQVDLSVRTLDADLNPDQSLIPDPTVIGFSPSGSTATLQLTPNLNASGNAIIEITLTDFGPDGNLGASADNATRVERFSVAVRPVNDPPTVSDQFFTVGESSPADTLVGRIVATDADQDRLRYEIMDGNTNDAFKIDTNSGDLLVNDQGALDLETRASFALTVVVTDLGSPPQAVPITVTVDLIDLTPEDDLTVNPGDWLSSDQLIVRRAGASLESIEIVNGDGVQIASRSAASVDEIIINGNDDIAESVVIDFSAGDAFGDGDPVPPLGLTFNGGSGAVEDSLTVQARLSSVFSSVAHTLTGPDSATIRANDNRITLNGVEAIHDSLRATQRTIVTGGEDDHLTLRAGASPGDFLAELETAGTAPFVTLGTPVSGLIIELGDGNDTFDVASFELGLRGRLTVQGQDGDDEFLISGLNGDTVTVDGGSGTDSLLEIVGSDLVIRDDRIEELSGPAPRLLAVMSGMDVVQASGTSGNDRLDATGFAGAVVLTGLSGDDVLIGGLGNDTLDGGDDRDRLIGGPGNDLLRGGMHADTLSGSEGVDQIDGESGADRLMETAGGTMVVTGSELHINGEVDSHSGIMSAFLFGESGDDVIDASAFPGWVRLTGGAGSDVLTGGRFSDILDGQDGHDRLNGLGGGDFLFGGNGNDTIDGADGADEIRGGRDGDSISAGSGDDFVVGEHGHDRIHGGTGNDRIIGGGGRDTLSGNGGDDVLIGNGGIDVVSEDIAGPMEVTRVGLNGAFTGSDSFGAIERVVLFGSDGADYVNGTGFRGSLTVFAGGGDDLVIGGQGDDVLYGGAGRDRLEGLAGDDVLAGNDGEDLLLGGAGDDFLVGGSGDDILDAGIGNDRLRGNGGDDSLRGGAGDDLLEGNSQSDLLLGGSGDDTLKGGKGSDSLLGEAGVDSLDGERNRDSGTGGGNGSGTSALDTHVNVEIINDAFSVDFDALIAAF